MKRLGFIVSGVVASMVLAASIPAQVLRTVDPTKRADDINNKNVSFDDADFPTLSPGVRSTTSLPLSGRKANYNDVNLSDAKLKSLNFTDISVKTLPQQNFTAKRAALPDKMPPQKQIIHTKAPITGRQIHPFKPGGEEELKKQLHDIPPPQPAEKARSPASSGK
jgi:hypothetical protein